MSSEIKVNTISKLSGSEITVSDQINVGSNKIKTSSTPSTGVDLVNYTYAQTIINRLYKDATGLKAVTADYVILDDDNYSHIIVDSRTGDKTITLPTLADNQGRKIRVSASYAGGKITVDGEGAELIDGDITLALQSQFDYVQLEGTATCWMVIACRCKFDTGWISSNDQTNRHFGVASIAFDGAVGTLLAGELVTEATSLITGIVVSGMAGTPLLLKNMTGLGVATNDRVWTGATSGATVVANGASKNADSNVAHNFGKSMSLLTVRHFWSSDGTEANSVEIPSYDAGGNIGVTFTAVDTNNLIVHSGSSGFSYMASAGASTVITASDWYYKVIVYYIK